MTGKFKFSNTFQKLGNAFYTPVHPRGLLNPALVCFDPQCFSLLGLSKKDLDENFVNIFSGNLVPENASPLSMVYAGHQFGGYSAQLGDGRGVLLGEVSTANSKWDLHLKGAGSTPYSRFGDGYAVLRSCIREYLGSIALHGLGISTTHALCIVRGDNKVQREEVEPAAILTRVARTHVRFGSFEYFHYTNQYERVKELADYVIKEFLPSEYLKEGCYDALFEFATKKTAQLIAHWQAVGFAHGVLNTDNMSIAGDTFDYGPYGFMEDYSPEFICNHSDTYGRYAFDQQPSIGLWNLNALAASLHSLLNADNTKKTLEAYEGFLVEHYYSIMYKKFGWQSECEGDIALFAELFRLMQSEKTDYTRFFRALSYVDTDNWKAGVLALTQNKNGEFSSWLDKFKHLSQQGARSSTQQQETMLANNPKYILRNYLAQQAIDAAYKYDYSEIERLSELLRTPFDEHPEMEKYSEAAPAWASNLVVSCSS